MIICIVSYIIVHVCPETHRTKYMLYGRVVGCNNCNKSFEFESRSWRGVLDTTLCDSLSVTYDRSVVSTGTPG